MTLPSQDNDPRKYEPARSYDTEETDTDYYQYNDNTQNMADNTGGVDGTSVDESQTPNAEIDPKGK